LYVVAEQAALAQEPCLIYRHRGIESSIHNEYLRVLMVAMAAVDTLTPRQIELADQLTASFVTSFPMQVQPGKGCHYYVDLSAARPPARLVDRLQSPAPNPRFYGPGPAGAQAEKLIQVIQSRQKIPEDLDLDGDCDPQSVIDVLRHLARQWASIPPARGEEREESSARLHIVHDFDTVLQAAQSVGRNPDLEREMETWTTLNASDSGFGAVLPEAPQEWLRVGTLIAARIEGTVSWGVGVIRRLTMNPNRQRFVGIQMVSRGATTVQLHPADTPADPNSDGEVALLLPSSGQESAGKGELNLLLKTGSFYSHRAVLMEFHQRGYHLMPKQVVDAGRDFEIVRFRVLQR